MSSLRRTLSTASHTWITESSSTALKRAQSSNHLTTLVQQHPDPHHHEEDENLNSEEKRGAFHDIWSSILSNKIHDSGSGSGSDPPYIHPMVKRTMSCLSDKSLDVCTESLGSETGSDGFGSLVQDPHLDSDPQDQPINDVLFFSNYNSYNNIYNPVAYETKEYNYSRVGPPPIPTPTKSMATSTIFPPPLPSLSHSHHMRSCRHDGRLVVEAVCVPPATRLHSLRRDGRLLLTLSSDDHEDDGGDTYNDDQEEFAVEFVMSKVIGTQKWRPRTFNATVIKDLDGEEEETPAATATAVVNSYEYYWRRGRDSECATVGVLKPVAEEPEAATEAAAADDEHLLRFFRGCKEPRRLGRSLLMSEPYWIAT